MFKSFNRTSTVFYSLILISVILITLLLVLTQQISVKDLVTVSLLPLVSTFIGATLAFQLNLYRDNLLEEKRRQTAFNRSLFILFRQINAVSSLASKLSEYDSNLTLAFNCPAFKPPEYSDLKQKFEDLEFILDFDPNLLMELTIEQECFEQLMASLNLRNDFYISEVQPAIERLQLNDFN